MSGRARALAGLAVVVAGGLAAGGGYALHAATKDDSTPAAATAPAATQSPAAAPTQEPTPTPTVTPTPALTPTATLTPSASPSAKPTVKPTATTRYYAYPAPTKKYDGLYFVAAKAVPSNDGSHGAEAEARAADGDGTIFVTSVDWGDGTSDGGEPNPPSCPAYPSPTAQPAPYRPHPDDRTFTRSHTYARPGQYTITIHIRSVNADCRPHGPKTETADATLRSVSIS